METITSVAASAATAATSITSAAMKLLQYAGTIAIVGAGVALVFLIVLKLKEKLFDDKKAN